VKRRRRAARIPRVDVRAREDARLDGADVAVLMTTNDDDEGGVERRRQKWKPLKGIAGGDD
jgi:hypothetical protein